LSHNHHDGEKNLLPLDWKQQLIKLIGDEEDVIIPPSSTSPSSEHALISSLFWNQIIQMDDHGVGSESENDDVDDSKHKPAKAVLRITSEEQILEVLKWLLEHKQKFSIKSGGHNKAGYSYCPNGFVLDLSRLNRIVDISHRGDDEGDNRYGQGATVTVQPGVHGLELIRRTLKPPYQRPQLNPTTAADSELPFVHAETGYGAVVGVCPTVALGGFILNGGYGWLSRQYGLGSDNLVNVRLVVMSTATSESDDDDGGVLPPPIIFAGGPRNDQMVPKVIDANMNQYSDLFWAMRGAGGGSFGVVTEMTYRLHHGYQDMNYNGVLFLELGDVPQFLVRVAAMDRAGELPRQFTMIAELYSVPGATSKGTVDVTSGGMRKNESAAVSNWFSEAVDLTSGMTSPVAFGCTWVSKVTQLDQGKIFLQQTLPLLAGENARMIVSDFPWTKNGATGADFPPSPPQYVECFSGFVTDATLGTMKNIVDRLHSWSEEWYPIIQPDTELWGGAISDVAANYTSFPHRRAIFNVAAIVYVDVDMVNAPLVFHDAVVFLKNNFHLLGLNGTYSNYQQRSLSSDEYPSRYFGENLERLKAIKKKYDPINVFDYAQGISITS
jgi:FAD/FMN-containing dehydrogenase